jgi:hypothetical protein
MRGALSCFRTPHQLQGEPFERIPYGAEDGGWDAPVTCHDCAVTLGGTHHRQCDMEQCPRCLDQFISCACRRT